MTYSIQPVKFRRNEKAGGNWEILMPGQKHWKPKYAIGMTQDEVWSCLRVEFPYHKPNHAPDVYLD